jgi:DNA-binding CsgD family transcriptional regulator
MINENKSNSAIYCWLCFLFSFSLYFCYFRAPFIKEGALFASSVTDAVFYAVSLFAAAWVLDRRPGSRRWLPSFSAGVCALSAIGMGMTKGIVLDVFILLFHISFAPMFVSSLFHLRLVAKKHLILSLVAIFILETLFWILLGDFLYRKLAVLLLATMAGVLIFLMRRLREPDEQVFRAKPFLEKLLPYRWLLLLFILQAFYLFQLTSLFWTKLKLDVSIVNGLPFRIFISLLFVVYGWLLDKKGFRTVMIISSGIVAVFQLVLLVPTSPQLIQMLLPLCEIGSIGFDLLLLTTLLIMFQQQISYRAGIFGFMLYQLIYGMPKFLPDQWLTTTLGRAITVISIFSALILLGFVLLLIHRDEKRKEAERIKVLEESLTQSLTARDQPDYELFGFSRREVQVAELLIQAKTRDEIGLELGLSRGTINTYCSSLYKKTGSTSQAEFISKLTLQKNNQDATSGKLLN